jgi:hypothetical protein
MVGTAARIRVSSVISNLSLSGTLKSTLTNAFLPLKLQEENFDIVQSDFKIYQQGKKFQSCCSLPLSARGSIYREHANIKNCHNKALLIVQALPLYPGYNKAFYDHRLR